MVSRLCDWLLMTSLVWPVRRDQARLACAVSTNAATSEQAAGNHEKGSTTVQVQFIGSGDTFGSGGPFRPAF
jgi:hypothetical protein